jgi:uncharacterized protein (DUF58 family)
MADGRAMGAIVARRSSARVGRRWAERADYQVDVAISLMTTEPDAGNTARISSSDLPRACTPSTRRAPRARMIGGEHGHGIDQRDSS